MPARLDPFVDVMLRERADQLYLLPDEPVTLIKDGKPRKVSKQPLTDQHIYALMVEVAPPEAADKIDQQSETEFDYAGRPLHVLLKQINEEIGVPKNSGHPLTMPDSVCVRPLAERTGKESPSGP